MRAVSIMVRKAPKKLFYPKCISESLWVRFWAGDILREA